MFLPLILGFLCATAAEESEVQQPPCNCTRTLQGEETTTDPPPPFPSTSFTCWGRYDGYYADVEVDCTIFHYCQTWQFPSGLNETVKWDFACPQSTIFNQRVLSCTPPNNSFDCQESPNYYWVNYNLTTSTTIAPTLPPTPDLSTPVSNIGQQLIVGDIGAQSGNFELSSPPSESPYEAEHSSTIFVSETPNFPSSSDQPLNTVTEGIESDAINFPV